MVKKALLKLMNTRPAGFVFAGKIAFTCFNRYLLTFVSDYIELSVELR